MTDRVYGPGAGPQRYPDPDVVVLDPRFAPLKIGNSPIQRLWTGALWAEGTADTFDARTASFAVTFQGER